MAIVLALIAALLWGVTDYVGGAMSRRASPFAVGVAELIAGAVCIIPVVLPFGGDPGPADFAWAAVAGLCAGVATGFFYRGLARGRMGVVAPVSAVGTALVPVTVGLALGDRPSALALTGVAIAFPGIWLLSSSPEPADAAHNRAGLADAAVAGALYGTVFVCLGQIGDDAGLLPLIALQAMAVLGMVLAALIARAEWLPRDRYSWRAAWLGPVIAIAIALFQVALHHGFLTIVAVIGSLYPATTVALAVVLLREPIRRNQAIGLLLSGAAVALVAAG